MDNQTEIEKFINSFWKESETIFIGFSNRGETNDYLDEIDDEGKEFINKKFMEMATFVARMGVPGEKREAPESLEADKAIVFGHNECRSQVIRRFREGGIELGNE